MYTGAGSLIGGNLPLLASTRIDRFQTGDTYTATYADHSNRWFQSALLYNLKVFGDFTWHSKPPGSYPQASRLGVGMCSAGLPGCVELNSSTVALRFEYLRAEPAIQELDIWCNIPNDYWWPYGVMANEPSIFVNELLKFRDSVLEGGISPRRNHTYYNLAS